MEYRLLRDLIVNSFDLNELREICFDLGINFDDLRGERISDKARELIIYCQIVVYPYR